VITWKRYHDNMIIFHYNIITLSWKGYHVIILTLSCYHDRVIMLAWQGYHVIMITCYHIFFLKTVHIEDYAFSVYHITHPLICYLKSPEWFCYAAYNSPKFNGFINCTFWSIIVVITLGKCAHRTPSGVRERHKCIGLI
jgi:hypothetical protein